MPSSAYSPLDAYVRLAFRRPLLLLAGWLLFTVAALWAARGIEVRTDLADMLPDDAPSVRAIAEAEARTGGSDMFTIAVQSPDPQANAEFLRRVAAQLQDWEEIEYLELKHEQAFFRQHALLLLPVGDLERIRDTLRRMVRHRLAEASPLFVELDRAEEREEMNQFDWKDPDAWINPLTLQQLGFDRDEVFELFPFIAEVSDDIEGPPVGVPDPELADFRLSGDQTIGILMARLRSGATDTSYSRMVYERGIAAIEAADPTSLHPEMHAEVVGAYRAFLEVRAIVADVRFATGLSIALVLLLLLLFFRSLRATFIVLTPLLLGIVWSLGAIRLLQGGLNTLTAFVFAMVIGMGIDFAIHLFRRFQLELAVLPDTCGNEGSSALAMRNAMRSTFRPLVAAALTTCFALLSLLAASFPGFREFGVASAVGVAMCLIATLFVVPVLTAALDTIRPHRAPREPLPSPSALATIQRRIPLMGILTAIMLALLVFTAPTAEFEYDFDQLSGPGSGRTIAYEEAVGRQRGTAPAVMIAESEEEMRAAHDTLAQAMVDGDPMIRSFLTIESILPSNQEERIEVIDEIADILDRRAVRRIDGDEGIVIASLRDMVDVEPFSFDDLPLWSRRPLIELDGAIGRLGLLYIDFPRSDARQMRVFQDRYGEIETPLGTVRLSSLSFILADVVHYVQSDGRRLPLLVGGALFLFLLIDLRSFTLAAVSIFTLALAALLTWALMGLFDVRIGLYNMVVLPMIMGVGVDGTIHLVHRARADGVANLAQALWTTGGAIAAAILTTAAGFAGLLFVSHLGVRSIGALALLGLASLAIVILGLLPALLRPLLRRRETRASEVGS